MLKYLEHWAEGGEGGGGGDEHQKIASILLMLKYLEHVQRERRVGFGGGDTTFKFKI